MPGRAIMLQGTGSNVGKSLLVAGLARAITLRGMTVRPFKPQNMSNNAAVTADGGEIGRAQALQALAAKTPPSIHMNPVLLKPESETGSQVVVHGKVFCTARAAELAGIKPQLMPKVMDSFQRLKEEADIVLVEGAGSASEINLRKEDIANMGFARAADIPVVLVGDIDRGGVIASLVGTKTVIDPADAALIEGFIVNRMRGDPALFSDGMAEIARQTGWRDLGLLPHWDGARQLPAEDAYTLAELTASDSGQKGGGRLKIAVPVLPRIANFDDLDPLAAEPDVDLVMVAPGEPIPANAEMVILPGSKATMADLASLRQEGWDIDIQAHWRRGGHVLGLCGGFQMLGRTIADPDGVEGPAGKVEGLGLLAVDTVLNGDKQVTQVEATSLADELAISGYEIHLGHTEGDDMVRPLHRLADGRVDGASSRDGRVSGTYIHGLFASDQHRAAWLKRLGALSDGMSYDETVDQILSDFAAHMERHVAVDAIISMAR
jgi:adenosylcobyric acid synthase